MNYDPKIPTFAQDHNGRSHTTLLHLDLLTELNGQPVAFRSFLLERSQDLLGIEIPAPTNGLSPISIIPHQDTDWASLEADKPYEISRKASKIQP